MQQLELDLFAEDRPERLTPLERFLDWAHRTHECGNEVDRIVESLFDVMPDASDRCKALVMVCGHGRFDRQVVDALGLFDRSLDYHVCWDRAWAATHGVPPGLISKVHGCDYRCGSGRHAFYDERGAILHECDGLEAE